MFNLKTMLFNPTGEYLNTVSWLRGLSIVARNRGTPIKYHDEVARSSNLVIEIPAHIVLTNYVKFNYHTAAPFCRENVYLRDEFRCQYCTKKFPAERLTLDHVMPKSRGGTLNWNNAVTACRECNNNKQDRTPEEAKMKLLNDPYTPTLKKIKRWRAKYGK